MKVRYIVITAALLMLAGVMAEQITIPNEFKSGEPAIANEVNENFNTLVVESNAQDSRLQSLESQMMAISKPVSDQLICHGARNWMLNLGEPTGLSTCVQQSFPNEQRELTFEEVMKEEWIAVSFGGETYGVFIFHKYE